jgi:hypothetical protein
MRPPYPKTVEPQSTKKMSSMSRRATDGRTFLKGLVSLAGGAGIALLVPFVVLVIGAPVALAVRGVAEAATWLLALICG